LAGKAGIVHTHMGDEKIGLSYLLDIVKNTDIPITQFAPTHLNRNEELFKDAIEFGKSGGYVDVTTGVSVESELTGRMIENGVGIERITMSTDGNGSMPKFNKEGEIIDILVSPVSSLYEAFVDIIKEEKMSVEDAIRVSSTNIAQHLKLYEKEG